VIHGASEALHLSWRLPVRGARWAAGLWALSDALDFGQSRDRMEYNHGKRAGGGSYGWRKHSVTLVADGGGACAEELDVLVLLYRRGTAEAIVCQVLLSSAVYV